ncbi:hypothetical protein FGO68_gene11622 [Halteria grandinella]|uniref:DNA/RNA-binding protein Alba-like domain-containing protein n=1 Tax=Halteria grandinella TaxID=5974 RepID=A0A8J8T609_HALGN|nr:hypothetical protein FGO68_gene11622 [Halteria grandinella]
MELPSDQKYTHKKLLREAPTADIQDPSTLLVKVSRKLHIREAIAMIEEAETKDQRPKRVVILGCEETISKAISVAEIYKRKVKEGHSIILKQATKIYRKEFAYEVRKTEEDSAIEKVKKSCIEIVLSLDEPSQI